MKIIPAIDLLGGKCVRLRQGNYSTQKLYYSDPLEAAKLFEDHGLRYLHLVDLDGARSKRIIHGKILERLATQTSLEIDFGGGIKSTADIHLAFESGARQVTVGSIAAREPELMLEWLQIFGPEKILLGADCRNRKIAINGWLENSDQDVIAFIRQYEKMGIACSIVSDVEKDGMLSGPSFALYEEILSQTTSGLIASGGISSLEDLRRLREIGCSGAIIGKGIYEGTIDLKKLSALC